MLGKLSIIGAVAAILIMATAVSAQMGGGINPGVHVGGAVNPGASIVLQSSADDGVNAMGNLRADDARRRSRLKWRYQLTECPLIY